MADLIREGIISSVNYQKGMAKVTYPDRDNEVTDNFPYLCYGEEYYMPSVGDRVLVAHLSTGEHEGVIIGKFWDGDHKSKKTGSGIFHQELPKGSGRTYISFEDGTLTIQADKIVLKGVESVKVESDKVTIDASTEIKKDLNVTQTTKAEDFITNTAKFNTHKHTGAHGETSGPH